MTKKAINEKIDFITEKFTQDVIDASTTLCMLNNLLSEYSEIHNGHNSYELRLLKENIDLITEKLSVEKLREHIIQNTRENIINDLDDKILHLREKNIMLKINQNF